MNIERMILIEQLISEKIAGIISPSDSEVLEEAIESDPIVAEIWRSTLAKFSHEDLASNFYSFDQMTWKAPKTFTKPTMLLGNRFAWRSWIMAAACFVGLVSVTFLIVYERQVEPRKNSFQKPHVELTMANGKTVNLSQDTGLLKVQDVNLTNFGKSLSFALPKDVSSAGSALNVLTVPEGMFYNVSLEDGTEVMLNSSSKLLFPFKFGNHREITIEGQAFIRVAGNASEPFVVRTESTNIEVLGTEFDVNSYEAGLLKVSLVSGAVRLRTPLQSIILRPGEQGIAKEGERIKVGGFDPIELSWRTGQYYFARTKIIDLTKVVKRWYGVGITIDDELTGNKIFTGRIQRDVPVKEFLEDLKATTSIDYYIDKDSIIHFK